MRKFVLLILSCLLSSCATRPGVPSDYKLDSASKNGLVVGTITYETSIGQYSLSWTSLDEKLPFIASVGYSMWPPLGPEFDDLLSAKGGTFAIEVPAGEYKLKRWFIRQGYIGHAAQNDIGARFQVEAGKITYLGNVNFQKNDEVALEDKASRDIPALKARFAAVKSSPIAFSISSGAKVEAIGGGSDRRFDSPSYIPIIVRSR